MVNILLHCITSKTLKHQTCYLLFPLLNCLFFAPVCNMIHFYFPANVYNTFCFLQTLKHIFVSCKHGFLWYNNNYEYLYRITL